MGELTKDQRSLWAKHKKFVKDHIDTVFEVGMRLQEIKKEKLYREDYDTFEAACQEEFSIGKSHAYRLIQSAEIVENIEKKSKPVSPIGDKIKPQNEHQTRILAELPDVHQPEAWDRAVEKADGKQPTAAQVKEAVKEVIETTSTVSFPGDHVVPPLFAPSGQEVPNELRPVFESDLFDAINRLANELDALAARSETDPAGRELAKDMERTESRGKARLRCRITREIKDLSIYEPYGIVNGDWVPKHAYAKDPIKK